MDEKKLEINASRQFTSWLHEHSLSLAFSTYQCGKLFFIGLNQRSEMTVFERNFERCMGLYVDGDSLYVGTLYQIWKLQNTLEKGQEYKGYDALYVPQLSYVTGDIDVHDIAISKDNEVIFANTLFSCVAKTSDTHSFKALWKPDFISKFSAEDRCHLNGLAMKNGDAAYASAVAQTDIFEGWREHRSNGGVIIDIQNNEIICEGLSMPHSPRWHNDKLWIHNSGTGYFGYIDIKNRKFEPVCFAPGYLRGMSFHENFAIIGLSKPRGNKTFSGLALDDNLAQKKISARCGLQIVDLTTGDIVHSLEIEGNVINEIYDVAVLPNIRKPMAIGFKTEEIRRMISIE